MDIWNKWRFEASLPAGRAPREHGNRLSKRAGDRVGFALFIWLDDKVGETEFVWVGCAPSATRCGLNERNLLLLQSIVADFTAIAAVGDQSFDGGAFFQIGQSFCQQLTVIHMVGCHLHFRDELDLIFRVAGFSDVGNITFVMPCAFRALGRFQIIHRLQAGGGDLGIFFGTDSTFDQVKVFNKDTFQYLVGSLDK
jgi:hypothetical protein